MIHFHPVEVRTDIGRDNPLYVGHFFELKGMWWRKRKDRQAMVLSVALAWHYATRRLRACPGMIEDEVLLTSITSKVSDAKQILTKFFKINRLGFNLNNGIKSPTLVSPKKLSKKMIAAIEEVLAYVDFWPGMEPTDEKLTKSRVEVRKTGYNGIKERLYVTGREDLVAPVNWMMSYEKDLHFYYQPSGKLQARDTSVWPIKNIEGWPSWLRKELFGTVVDIENAYAQFLCLHLIEKNDEATIARRYPDIFRADRDKKNFREEICRDVLKMDVNPTNIGHVKKLLMSLANGSTISGTMMTSSGRSEAVRIVLQANTELTPLELHEAGERLKRIAAQFRSAKREMCLHILKIKPTAKNIKKIFHLYFNWEREQRHKIWHAIGCTGLMLHDGIDGVISPLSDENLVMHILKTTSVKVSVDSLLEFSAA